MKLLDFRRVTAWLSDDAEILVGGFKVEILVHSVDRDLVTIDDNAGPWLHNDQYGPGRHHVIWLNDAYLGDFENKFGPESTAKQPSTSTD